MTAACIAHSIECST